MMKASPALTAWTVPSGSTRRASPSMMWQYSM
ncbi:Uncharacterised protein [Bordetella pertussis]|nr:Uncharacterised protein [Bordetella pertussis]